MRISLSLDPTMLAPQPKAGPSSGPLAQLGGEVVIVELQGELGWEGDKGGGVVGVLGLDRPDKPTLHLGPHHLLHGKFVNLPKPLAVIRRGVASKGAGAGAVQGDADEEEDDEVSDGDEGAFNTPHRPGDRRNIKKRRLSRDRDAESDDEPPLFPANAAVALNPVTPVRVPAASSSSPFLPPSTIKDFSSELDFSSPPPSSPPAPPEEGEDEKHDEEAEAQREAAKRRRLKLEAKRAERRAARPERTRVYEVVGVVRKKVVFGLRPEPIVTATILPD